MTNACTPVAKANPARAGVSKRPLRPRHVLHPRPLAQRGITLIELMVGIAIGLLVVAVATSALMVSRGISGTVSDASNLHQQAAYAMRVIGQQLRQGGSLYLNLNPSNDPSNDPATPVALEVVSQGTNLSGNTSFNPISDTLATQQTLDGRTILGVGYRRFVEPLFGTSTDQSLSRNCIGEQGGSGTDNKRIESIFMLDGEGNLRCGANPNSLPKLGFTGLPNRPGQPIVRNVANFRVRYLEQSLATLGAPEINYVEAASFSGDLARVQGVEICLVLYGDERIDLPAGSQYTDCDGSRVDMTAAALPVNRRNRMHLMFRNVFQLRSQGLIGSVL